MQLLRLAKYRIAITVGLSLTAIALQWTLASFTGSRFPFVFFLPMIVLAGTIGGGRDAAATIAIAVVNAMALYTVHNPGGIHRENLLTTLIFLVVSSLLAALASTHRKTLVRSDRHMQDMHELHELGLRLSGIPRLSDQLNAILNVAVSMNEAKKGLISHYRSYTETLSVAAHVGFSEKSLEAVSRMNALEGVCGIACREKRRVIVYDIQTEPGLESCRDLAAEEGFRSVHSTPILDRNGELFGVLSLHFEEPTLSSERTLRLSEICTRVAAVHIERERSLEEIGEQDSRFKGVLQASAVPFVILNPIRDENHVIVDFSWNFVNGAAAKTLKRDADTIVGRRLSVELPGIWNVPGLFATYVRAIQNNDVTEFEHYLNAAGIKGWFHTIASPMGESIAVWFADITQRKADEQALRDADRRKDEFLATLAHELRNPLAPIRQAAKIAELEHATDAQKHWSHAVIERQVQHMSLLLDDLLDVSRITRGRLELRKERTDVASIVNAAAEVARPSIEGKQHRLELKIPDAPILVFADPLRCSQILSNLLVNAAKYTDAHGAITLRAAVDGGDLVLSVSDSGIGFDADELQGLFHMFSQVKHARDRSEGGLGIGLALTKGLVELHGGTIRAQSEGRGKGSVFTLRLPIVITDEPRQGARNEARTPSLRISRKIVVADDNSDALESLAMLLEVDGHSVFKASNGAEALELFQRHRPEIMLLDIGMPILSGYDVALRVKAQAPGTFLVAISGWGLSTDKEKARAAGFDRHLTKPVNYEVLTALIESHTPNDAANPRKVRTQH